LILFLTSHHFWQVFSSHLIMGCDNISWRPGDSQIGGGATRRWSPKKVFSKITEQIQKFRSILKIFPLTFFSHRWK